MEIFVRFREEEDKLLPPGTFFPILEANHLTPLLDRWVVREVLRWAAEKQTSQPNWHIPRFNLNLADDTIRDKDFGGQVRDQLKETKIPSNRLWFEMTSQQMARFPDAAKQTITRLKSLGCAIAVSDFFQRRDDRQGLQGRRSADRQALGSVVRNAHRSPEALSKLLELNGCCTSSGFRPSPNSWRNPKPSRSCAKSASTSLKGSASPSLRRSAWWSEGCMRHRVLQRTFAAVLLASSAAFAAPAFAQAKTLRISTPAVPDDWHVKMLYVFKDELAKAAPRFDDRHQGTRHRGDAVAAATASRDGGLLSMQAGRRFRELVLEDVEHLHMPVVGDGGVEMRSVFACANAGAAKAAEEARRTAANVRCNTRCLMQPSLHQAERRRLGDAEPLSEVDADFAQDREGFGFLTNSAMV